MSLSISVSNRLQEVEQINLQKTLSPGWVVRVEWWNGYNQRTYIASRVSDTIELAKEDVLRQFTRLIQGASLIRTYITLSVLEEEYDVKV